MPTKKQARPDKKAEPVTAEEKIARCLGLLLVREMEQKTEQATVLRSIGFEVSEVGAMLNMSENHVAVAVHAGRKKLARKSAKASKNG